LLITRAHILVPTPRDPITVAVLMASLMMEAMVSPAILSIVSNTSKNKYLAYKLCIRTCCSAGFIGNITELKKLTKFSP
jgi:hypothetical protein